MNRSWRRFSAACAVALAAASPTFAQLAALPTALPPTPRPVAVGALDSASAPAANAPHAANSHGPAAPGHAAHSHSEPVTHSTGGHAREEEAACGDVLLDAEYLLLAARRTGQTYAIVGTNPNWGPVGVIKSVDGHYDSGLRVGAGYRLEKGWDVIGRYTYYHSSANAVTPRPDNQKLFATLTHPSTVVEVGGATASTRVNFNLADFELGKKFELAEELNLRTFGGLRYANLDQNLQALYQGGDALTDEVRRGLYFEGGGVRAGGDLRWKPLDHLGLYLRGSASMLTGTFTSSKSEVANGNITIVDVNERYARVVPMMDLGVGFSLEKGNFRLSAGYEWMQWYNVVDASDFVDDAHPGKLIRSVGNLGFDGVVFRAEMSF